MSPSTPACTCPREAGGGNVRVTAYTRSHDSHSTPDLPSQEGAEAALGVKGYGATPVSSLHVQKGVRGHCVIAGNTTEHESPRNMKPAC